MLWHIWSVILVLKQCFDRFDSGKNGFISAEAVGGILSMMGLKFSSKELKEIIAEIDVDGNNELNVTITS